MFFISSTTRMCSLGCAPLPLGNSLVSFMLQAIIAMSCCEVEIANASSPSGTGSGEPPADAKESQQTIVQSGLLPVLFTILIELPAHLGESLRFLQYLVLLLRACFPQIHNLPPDASERHVNNLVYSLTAPTTPLALRPPLFLIFQDLLESDEGPEIAGTLVGGFGPQMGMSLSSSPSRIHSVDVTGAGGHTVRSAGRSVLGVIQAFLENPEGFQYDRLWYALAVLKLIVMSSVDVRMVAARLPVDQQRSATVWSLVLDMLPVLHREAGKHQPGHPPMSAGWCLAGLLQLIVTWLRESPPALRTFLSSPVYLPTAMQLLKTGTGGAMAGLAALLFGTLIVGLRADDSSVESGGTSVDAATLMNTVGRQVGVEEFNLKITKFLELEEVAASTKPRHPFAFRLYSFSFTEYVSGLQETVSRAMVQIFLKGCSGSGGGGAEKKGSSGGGKKDDGG
jgi:hypothetical protein